LKCGSSDRQGQDRAEHVDFDRPDPGVPGDRLDRPQRAVHAGVVDEHLQVRKVAQRPRDQRVDIVWARHVRRLSEHACVAPGKCCHLAARGLEHRRVAGAQHHVRAGLDECPGDGQPEALAGTGDERGSTGERSRHATALPTLT